MSTEIISDADKEKSPSSKNNRYNADPLPNPIAVELKSNLPKLKLWALVILALIIGFGCGVMVMKNRHKADSTVAAVNGTVITQDDFFSRLQKASGATVLHQMVQEQLQLQYAAKKGVEPTDAAVDQKYAALAKNPNFTQQLAASGLTPSDYKQSLRVQLAQVAVLTQGITVTDADIHSFYAAESDPRNPKAQFYQPEAIQLRAIATLTKDMADKASQELASNTQFDMVASQYSVDPSKNNGGLEQPILRGRTLLARMPALEQSIFSLKAGQLLGPVKIVNGWWIFKCEQKAPSKTVPFAVAQDDCRVGAEIVKGTKLNGKAVAADFADFQQKSNLQAFWTQYKAAIQGH